VAIAVPNLRHVEYFHDHSRCDSLMFDGVLSPMNGLLVPASGVVGHGMSMKDLGNRYRIA
jgi:hypothetical protein